MPPEPGETLRVVLDTNVLISAFTHPLGIPSRIWQHALKGHYQLLLSPAIVREAAGVLRTDFAWEETAIISQLKLLVRVGDIITPTFTLSVIVRDPSDNRILECAVAGKAHLIVSGDHHLHRLEVYQRIPIVRPVDFLRTLGGGGRR